LKDCSGVAIGGPVSKLYLSSPYDYNPKLYEQVRVQAIVEELSGAVRFDSAFESGNLHQVFWRSNHPNDFYLTLSNDTNTHGYNEWFFFRVDRLPKTTCNLYIVNMHKRSSLYTEGFQVSVCTAESTWQKTGSRILYYNSKLRRNSRGSSDYYYCLSFSC